MKQRITILFLLLFTHSAFAGGSIGWDEVSDRLSKDCPELLTVINTCFDVSRVGGALRLGSRSIDVIEGRDEIGTRVPPYEFDCKVKGTSGPYILRMEISDSDDGWKFIIRSTNIK